MHNIYKYNNIVIYFYFEINLYLINCLINIRALDREKTILELKKK